MGTKQPPSVCKSDSGANASSNPFRVSLEQRYTPVAVQLMQLTGPPYTCSNENCVVELSKTPSGPGSGVGPPGPGSPYPTSIRDASGESANPSSRPRLRWISRQVIPSSSENKRASPVSATCPGASVRTKIAFELVGRTAARYGAAFESEPGMGRAIQVAP
jgi:hypothetical protein